MVDRKNAATTIPTKLFTFAATISPAKANTINKARKASKQNTNGLEIFGFEESLWFLTGSLWSSMENQCFEWGPLMLNGKCWVCIENI